MLQELKSVCIEHTETSRLSRCCSKIPKFSNTFAPYFEILNIFVQVKPEYMGIIWGSIRLIFQVSGFERLYQPGRCFQKALTMAVS